jgi:hypothetical protein
MRRYSNTFCPRSFDGSIAHIAAGDIVHLTKGYIDYVMAQDTSKHERDLEGNCWSAKEHALKLSCSSESVSSNASVTVIVLVTFLFLPASFISVSNIVLLHRIISNNLCPYSILLMKCLQTVISVDIVKWEIGQEPRQGLQSGAFKLYLAITIPFMVLTFAAWGIMYWWMNRRQNNKASGGASKRPFGFPPLPVGVQFTKLDLKTGAADLPKLWWRPEKWLSQSVNVSRSLF